MNEILRQEKMTISRPEMSNLSSSLSNSSLIVEFTPSSSQTNLKLKNELNIGLSLDSGNLGLPTT